MKKRTSHYAWATRSGLCMLLVLGLMAPALDAFAQHTPLTFDQILGLIEDVDETDIIEQIVAYQVECELAEENTRPLIRAGASDELLDAIESNCFVFLAQSPLVKIDEIGRYIEGKVSNLDNPQEYKVLIYVLTDQWYIHPYEGQREGGSWAAIDTTGSWSIRTVKRENIANGIAALVVDPSVAEDAPNHLSEIQNIKHHAIIIYSGQEMRENNWYELL